MERLGLFVLVLLLAGPARPQPLPYSFQKSQDKTKPDVLDATSVQENFEFLANQARQNKAAVANLTVNGVVVSVGATTPLCSSGGTNPSISLCGSVPGSSISGNISGNAANVTGVVAIANGGTGATTAAGALANLGAANAAAVAASTAAIIVSTGVLQTEINGKQNAFTGISSACAAGYYLSTGTWVNGVATGGGCVRALQPTNWTPTIGGATIGAPNVCDEMTFNQDGLLTATNDPELCALAESQVTNLTTDLANKLSASGPATFTGNLTIQATGSGANGLTVTNGGGINAYFVNTTTGITTGGAGSTISGTLTVGTGSFPGNVVALGVGAGVGEFNDLELFDASSPKSSSTIESTGGAQFGCSVPGTGCVQTIGSDGRIPAISTTYFQNMNGSKLTGIPSTGSISGFYYPLAAGIGSPLTGEIYQHMSSPNYTMQDTSDTDGTYLGDIVFANPTAGRHQIISTGQNASGVNGFMGMLVIGAAVTVDTAGGNRGVSINPREFSIPGLFVSTYNWTSVGSTNPVTNGNSGLWVGGNEIDTGTLTVQGSAFSVGGTTLVVNDGNLGIGTTSPTANLQVAGGPFQVTGTGNPTAGGGNGIEFNGGNLPYVQSINSGRTTFLPFTIVASSIIFSPSSTEAMRIVGSFVGVGTTNPAGTFTVQDNIGYGGSGNRIGTIMGCSSANQLKCIGIGYDNSIDAAYISAQQGGVNYKNIVLQGTGGQVMIGTTTAASVNAPISVSGSVPRINFNASQAGHRENSFQFSYQGTTKWAFGTDLPEVNNDTFQINDSVTGQYDLTISTNDQVAFPQVTTGDLLCLTAAHVLGHCSVGVVGVTCTCVAN